MSSASAVVQRSPPRARVPASRRARRCGGRPGRRRGRAEQREGGAHRGRIGVVALVDQREWRRRRPCSGGCAPRPARPAEAAERPRAAVDGIDAAALGARAARPSAFMARCRPGAPSRKPTALPEDAGATSPSPAHRGRSIEPGIGLGDVRRRYSTCRPARPRPGVAQPLEGGDVAVDDRGAARLDARRRSRPWRRRCLDTESKNSRWTGRDRRDDRDVRAAPWPTAA